MNSQLSAMTRIANKKPAKPAQPKNAKNAAMQRAIRLKAALMPQVSPNPQPTMGQPSPMSDMDGDE